MEREVQQALEFFQKGLSCSQSVFGTFAPKFRFDLDDALRIGTPFGGGMGLQGQVCGAVTGAFMALSLKYGTDSNAGIDQKKRCYEIVREFSARFLDVHKTLLCRDLTGCDLTTEKGSEKFQRLEIKKKVCEPAVQTAVKLLLELL